jgi:hypothetical protein
VPEPPPVEPVEPVEPVVVVEVVEALSRASVNCCSALSTASWSSLTAWAASVLSTSASFCPACTTSPGCTEMLVTVLEMVKERLRVCAGSTDPMVPTWVVTAPRSTATVTTAFGFSDAPAVRADTSV